MTETPSEDEIEQALTVLLWLHEVVDDGRDRDSISQVRSLLQGSIDGEW